MVRYLYSILPKAVLPSRIIGVSVTLGSSSEESNYRWIEVPTSTSRKTMSTRGDERPSIALTMGIATEESSSGRI
jgi:hypothetical protein